MPGIAEIGILYNATKIVGALAIGSAVTSNCDFVQDKSNCENVPPSIEYQAIQRYANEEVIVLDINLAIYGQPQWISKRFHAHGCKFVIDAKDDDLVTVRVYKGFWCNDISLTKQSEQDPWANAGREAIHEN